MRLSIRIFVSLLAATFVWLLAPRSALAAAPLCDARGAIMFAPPPTLEEPNASVDIGQADDCNGASADDQSLQHGQRGSSTQTAGEDGGNALVAQSPTILPAAPADVLVDADETIAVPNGVHSRVDRPPRL